MKNSNNDIGNRTRDLPVCSALTTTPPRPIYYVCYQIYCEHLFIDQEFEMLRVVSLL